MVIDLRTSGFQQERRERVHQLLKLIVNKGPIKSGKLVSLLHYEWGITPKKILEYLRELESLGAVELNPKVEATAYGKKLLEK